MRSRYAWACSAIRSSRRQGSTDYEELDARLLHSDEALDLAMLEIPVGGTRAVSVSSSSRRGGQRRVISIVPFGRPTLLRSFHPYLHKGQSGSPDLREGVV